MTEIDGWIQTVHQAATARAKILCLPHAGGSSAEFRHWYKLFDVPIELTVAEFPGRGRRISEPLGCGFFDVVGHLHEALIAEHSPLPLIIFGHSMGATVGFELVRCLERQGRGPRPVLFIPSACRPPALIYANPADRRSTLPDKDLLDLLRRLNGTPQEVLECGELMDIVLPALRSDLRVIEGYVPESLDVKIRCPIVALGGMSDTLGPEAIIGWSLHTSGGFRSRMFPGGHFYFKEQTSAVFKYVGKIIAELIC